MEVSSYRRATARPAANLQRALRVRLRLRCPARLRSPTRAPQRRHATAPTTHVPATHLRRGFPSTPATTPARKPATRFSEASEYYQASGVYKAGTSTAVTTSAIALATMSAKLTAKSRAWRSQFPSVFVSVRITWKPCQTKTFLHHIDAGKDVAE